MKKKFILTILSVFMFLGLVFGVNIPKSFASTTETQTYKITFVTNCSETLPEQNLNANESISLPTPSRDGYVFLGWYNDENFDSPFIQTTMTDEDITLYAKWHFVFEIENDGNFISVKSNQTETAMFENISEAILNITNYSITNNLDGAYLKFNNFNLDNLNEEEIVFECSDIFYHISGNISSSSEKPIINVSQSKNITLYSENILFNNPSSNYAIFVSSKNNTLYFGGNITYSSKYFVNYLDSNNFYATNQKLTNTITITLPYNSNRVKVISLENIGSKNFINIVSESSSYIVSQNYYNNLKYFEASVYFPVKFDENEGSFSSNKYSNFIQNCIYNFNFPTSAEISKNYSIFDGWFGKFNYSNVDYYFDSEMLSKFAETGYDLSQISAYFVTDTTLLNSDFSFNGYTSNDTENYETNKHLIFFLENGETPTYIAKWSKNKYRIYLETNQSDISYETLVFEYDEKLTLPTPSKTGYSFVGWYKDSNLATEFTLTKMPANNLTLYAKWTKVNYYLNLDLNGGIYLSQTYLSMPYNYGDDIDISNISPFRAGYNFLGWFSDANLSQKFNLETMPNYSFSIYAKWEIKRIKVTLNLFGADFNGETEFEIDYGSTITKPINEPTKDGYTFLGWYTSSLSSTLFDFSKPITSETIIYSRWDENTYTLSYITNCMETVDPVSLKYQEKLIYPETLDFTGHTFLGWFYDKDFETPVISLSTMPAKDITIYAKWDTKEVIILNLSKKEFTYGDAVAYKNYSDLMGFELYYYVNETWTKEAPTNVGSYNIKITRSEDNNYQAFEQIYENFVIINPVQKDIKIIIFILYFFTFVELAVILFVKRLRKLKRNVNYSVVFGTWFISTTQFANLIISAVVFLIGFIMLFYELLKTHKTEYNEHFEKSKKDSRERFKEELVFQNNVKINPEYEYETKTKESFGSKYTNEDIERMLVNDTYNKDRLKNKKSNDTDENPQDLSEQESQEIINNLTIQEEKETQDLNEN